MYRNLDGSCVSRSYSAGQNPYRNAPQQPLLVALVDDKELRRTFRKDLIVLVVGQHFLLYGIRLWNGQLAANHRCLQTRFQTLGFSGAERGGTQSNFVWLLFRDLLGCWQDQRK